MTYLKPEYKHVSLGKIFIQTIDPCCVLMTMILKPQATQLVHTLLHISNNLKFTSLLYSSYSCISFYCNTLVADLHPAHSQELCFYGE